MSEIVHPTNPQAPNKDLRWWGMKRPHENVFANVEQLKQSHDSRVTELRSWLTLYLDKVDDGTYNWAQLGLPGRQRRHRLNAIANGIRTVHSQISINRPRPWAVTSGGDWALQDRGKKMTKYLEGEFDRLEVDELASEALEDCLWAGHGFVHCYDDGERPALEIVWPGEIMIDKRERRYGGGKARTMYRRKSVDREILLEEHPEHKNAINTARMYDDGQNHEDASERLSDQVLVVESWHLPTRKRKPKDGESKFIHGRHVKVIEGATLFDEPWEEDRFPIAEIKYIRNPRDYFGIGLAEFMSGIQAELDHVTGKNSECFNLSVPRIRVSPGGNVNTKKLGNTPTEVVEANQGDFEIIVAPAVNRDQTNYQGDLLEQAYNLNGVSMMSAQLQKPAGLNSGRAQLVHQDIESRGQMRLARNWEAFHVDLGKLILMVTKRIAQDEERAAELKTLVGGSDLEEVSWADATIKDDPYRIKVFPVSSLSKSPAGRLEQVQQMIDMQILTDPDEIRELLDYPDLERHSQINGAQRDVAEKLVERALDGKKAEAFGEMDLGYARKWGTLRLCLAELQNAPENGRQRLRDFLSHIDQLEATAAAAAQAEAQAMQPPMPPPAGPAGPALPPMGGPPPMPMPEPGGLPPVV